MERGLIHSLESFGTLDGPGIRFVVFFQGCPLRCLYCHNPDTQATADGQPMTVDAIAKRIESCRRFLTGGVTLSGGEPLCQPEFATALLNRCRAFGFHTALDTAGSLPLKQTRAALDAADLVLLDIKSLDDAQCRQLTGRGNAETLATLDYCEKTGKPVWIRHVLVPDWTLDRERLRELAAYLAGFRCVEKVELLSFHHLGAPKYTALGRTDPLENLRTPTPEESADAERIFGLWK